MSESLNRHYSGPAQGKLLVQGDVYAQNIHLVTPTARSMYRTLNESPNVLGPLHSKVEEVTKNILSVASITEEYSTEGKMDAETRLKFEEIAKNCRFSLGKLQVLSKDFETWNTQSLQEEEIEQIADLLQKQIEGLEDINTTIRESVIQLESLIKRYVAEVKDGQRASSIRTNVTTATISTLTTTEWQQIQQEMREIGISPTQFNENKVRIIQMLQMAFEGQSSFDDGKPNIPVRIRAPLFSLNPKKPGRFSQWLKPGGSRALIRAIREGNLSQVELALKNSPDALLRNGSVRTLLLAAIKTEKVEMVRIILTYSPSLEQVDFTNWEDNPLCLAIRKKDINIMNVLLEHNINAKCSRCQAKEEDPLLRAVTLGDTKILKEILGAWKRRYPQELFSRGDVICLAVEYGWREKVKTLINCGISVNASIVGKSEHKTPLSQSIVSNDLDMVKLLLENHADVNPPSKGLNIPLSLAVKVMDHELIQLLLDYGANPNAGHQHTAFKYETFRESWVDYKDDTSPLLVAVELQSFKIVQHLLRYSSQSNIDPCLLKRAIELRQKDLINLLLSDKEHSPSSEQLRRLPLCAAAATGDLGIVQLLVDNHGADVDATMRWFEDEKAFVSPIWIAAALGHQKILEFLLERNANIHRSSECISCLRQSIKSCLFARESLVTCNPTQIAVAHGHLSCAELLIARGGRINDPFFCERLNVGGLLQFVRRLYFDRYTFKSPKELGILPPDLGIDINIPDADAATCLYYAMTFFSLMREDE